MTAPRKAEEIQRPAVKDPTDTRYWFWCRYEQRWLPDESCEAVAKTLAPTRQTGRMLQYEADKEEGERPRETRHRRLRDGFRLLKGAYL